MDSGWYNRCVSTLDPWHDVAKDTVLPLLPVFRDVRVELLEGSDCLPRPPQVGQDMILHPPQRPSHHPSA